MTDDKQDRDPDAGAESAEAVRRPAGLVYLVPNRPSAGDGSSDAGNRDAGHPDDHNPGDGNPGDGLLARHGAKADQAVAAGADGVVGGRSVQHGGRTPTGGDWPWVAEWRAGGEPTPWATGLPVTAFFALVVGVAVWVLSAGLADRPIVAVLVNLLVVGGLAPAMWLSKDLPVLRWIAAGALVGIVGGWIAALMMLPMPAS